MSSVKCPFSGNTGLCLDHSTGYFTKTIAVPHLRPRAHVLGGALMTNSGEGLGDIARDSSWEEPGYDGGGGGEGQRVSWVTLEMSGEGQLGASRRKEEGSRHMKQPPSTVRKP